MRTHSVVSLAEIRTAGISLRPAEAVTIVRELALQVSRGELPGVPSAHVIRLSADGRLVVEGPVAADDDNGVNRTAHLLDSLLPGFDAPPELRVSGALRLVLARALGTLDLAPFPSVLSMAEALARFSAPDPIAVVRDLVASCTAALNTQPATAAAEAESAVRPEPAALQPFVRTRGAAGPNEPAQEETKSAPLTISDIRRARRATGLSLKEIAERSRIPAGLLRELEWGDLRNWPGGLYGRTQLVRYARAAGLDDQLVIRTAWPLVEEWGGKESMGPIEVANAGEAAESRSLEAREPSTRIAIIPQRPASDRDWLRKGALAALAIPALLAVGVAPALWGRSVLGNKPGVEQAKAAPVERGTGSNVPVVAVNTAAPSPAATSGSTVPEPAASAPAAPTPAPGPWAQTPSAPAGATAEPVSYSTTPEAQPDADPTPAIEPAVSATTFPVQTRGVPGASVFSPSFASVGTAMFYHAESGGQSALMRADTDSRGAILRITSVVNDRANNFHARPSPDGKHIAFDSDRDGERGVYIADADGRQVRRVSGEGFAAVPSWSPNGSTLAFVRAETNRPRVWNLWTTDLDSGRTRRLTSHRVGQPWGGSWFPDGRRIAYSHEQNLVILDTATGQQKTYSSPVKGRLLRTPAVSPDGERVMFQVYRDGAWLLELSNGTMRKILSDPSAEEYTWAPDGRRVAYHSRRSGTWGVWVMAPR